jgi:hypothetical protein
MRSPPIVEVPARAVHYQWFSAAWAPLLPATVVFFLGMATLLLFVMSLGMFRSAAKRAAARRADRKKVSELSNKLDAYKRDERESNDDIQRDDV